MLRVSIDGEISNNGMRYLHTAPRYQQSFKKKNRRGWCVKAANLSWLGRDEAETLIWFLTNSPASGTTRKGDWRRSQRQVTIRLQGMHQV